MIQVLFSPVQFYCTMVNTTQTFLTGLVVFELVFCLLLILPFGDSLKQKAVTTVDGIPAFAFVRYFVLVILLILIALFASSQNDMSNLTSNSNPQHLLQNVNLHRELLVLELQRGLSAFAICCLIFLERYYSLLARNTRSLRAQEKAEIMKLAMEKQALNLHSQTTEYAFCRQCLAVFCYTHAPTLAHGHTRAGIHAPMKHTRACTHTSRTHTSHTAAAPLFAHSVRRSRHMCVLLLTCVCVCVGTWLKMSV